MYSNKEHIAMSTISLQATMSSYQRRISSLTLCIEDNQSAANITKVQKIALFGPTFMTSASGMPIKIYGQELACVNMEHLDVKDKSRDASVLYEAAFNDGDRALQVSCSVGNAGSEGVIISVPEEGLVRMVHVTLLEEEMGKLLLSWNSSQRCC